MVGQTNRRARRAPMLLLVLTLAGGLVSCRPEILVRLSTTIYHDGSLDRKIEVRGRTDKGEEPEKEDWLRSDVGLHLAEPEAWARVVHETASLRAEGFFVNAESLPPMLSYSTQGGPRNDRVRTALTIEHKIVITRWTFRELHGDPFSATDSSRALDALIELAVEALRSELTRQFGQGFNTAPAEELMRLEGRSLASSLMSVKRRDPGPESYTGRVESWFQVLSQHGIPVAPATNDESFWESQIPVLLEWSGRRIAQSLSTDGTPIHLADLDFWPVGDEIETKAMEIVERVWGGEEELEELLGEHVEALEGYYASNSSPRLRFRARVTVPGVLLRTNGTPHEDGIEWLFRAEDLAIGEFALRAESVEANVEALTRLGARRSLGPPELLHLTDLLWKRDPEGVLAELLAEALDRGSLEVLRDEIPEEHAALVRELHDLLNPEIPLDDS